jgi:hypothetical protein
MKELGSSVGSGEHIISESVCEVLMAHGDFAISGLPWLEAGEEKIIAPLGQTGFSPRQLEIEITETVSCAVPERARWRGVRRQARRTR